jgi:hypothetical protein
MGKPLRLSIGPLVNGLTLPSEEIIEAEKWDLNPGET